MLDFKQLAYQSRPFLISFDSCVVLRSGGGSPCRSAKDDLVQGSCLAPDPKVAAGPREESFMRAGEDGIAKAFCEVWPALHLPLIVDGVIRKPRPALPNFPSSCTESGFRMGSSRPCGFGLAGGSCPGRIGQGRRGVPTDCLTGAAGRFCPETAKKSLSKKRCGGCFLS